MIMIDFCFSVLLIDILYFFLLCILFYFEISVFASRIECLQFAANRGLYTPKQSL